MSLQELPPQQRGWLGGLRLELRAGQLPRTGSERLPCPGNPDSLPGQGLLLKARLDGPSLRSSSIREDHMTAFLCEAHATVIPG